MSSHLLPDARQALRYALLSGVALMAIALGDVILKYTFSLYLAFQPGVFLREGYLLLAAVAVFAGLGGWLDQRRNFGLRRARVVRAVLLTLILVSLFQVFRQSLATTLALPAAAKAGVMLGSAGLAALLAWRMPAEALWRLCGAAALAMVTMFALQPGMPAYLMKALSPGAHAPTPAAAAPAAVARRSVVIVFDEWDMEIARREGFFELAAMRALLGQSFFAERALPAGSNTLESIPSMLMGKPFGAVDTGGAGYLRSKTGERFDASAPNLFGDMRARGVAHAVFGFYHDYCALAPAARSCHAEPIQFFPGWEASFSRAVRRTQEFDFPYSDFLRQWHSTYARLHEDALRAVDDLNNQMVWIHINVPHPPSAQAKRLPRGLLADYRANLELTAQLIDEVAQRLKAQGAPAALILTSDHWLRERELWSAMYERQRGAGSGKAGKSDDLHVPLIVWFSESAASGLSHAPEVSTMAIRDLVPGVLEGRLGSPTDVAAFFAARPRPAPMRRSDSASVH